MSIKLRPKPSTETKSKSSQPACLIPENLRWLKVGEAAAYLRVSIHHVYRMHRRGQIPSVNLPGLGVRIDRKALEAKMQSVKEARARAAGVTWPS